MKYTSIAVALFFSALCIYLLHRALEWARREPGRKYPDGVPVWYGERLRVVYRANYYRGRWWYELEGIEKPVRQEDIT